MKGMISVKPVLMEAGGIQIKLNAVAKTSSSLKLSDPIVDDPFISTIFFDEVHAAIKVGKELRSPCRPVKKYGEIIRSMIVKSILLTASLIRLLRSLSPKADLPRNQ
jgi:hypothetical protein